MTRLIPDIFAITTVTAIMAVLLTSAWGAIGPGM